MFEARIARRFGFEACCGARACLEREMERALQTEGCCEGIVSFGICGGLDPDLGRGAVVIADRVLVGGEAIETDAEWRRRLFAMCDGAVVRTALGVDEPILGPAHKARLHEETGAAICDAESGVVAQFAARRGLPFAVLRAVADPAQRQVPASLATVIRDDGRLDLGRACVRILAQPGKWPDIVRLAQDARAARASLAQAARSLRFDRSALEFG
jgi:hopanoid-associated phosphorylase